MESSNDTILSVHIPPLIPYSLLDEYNDFINTQLREVLRATCLRRYLEGAIDMLMKEKVLYCSGMSEESWDRQQLNYKIQMIGKYYNKNIENKFHELRKIGNKGAHPGETVCKEDIDRGIEIATSIFEDLLIRYFSEHRAGTEPPVLTMLSSLPPIKRVYIWEKLWVNDKENSWIIDKLSMAYLKSGQIDKSLGFLKSLHEEKTITDDEYNGYILKIKALEKYMSNFDISKNILDIKRIFNCLITEEDYLCYPEFVNIFLVLVSGYNSRQGVLA